MKLSEEEKNEYIKDLEKELKTTLFFSYFYNFYLVSSTSPNQEFKIGGELMNYSLPAYNQETKTISFDFFFANNDVWDFYHEKGEDKDGLKVEKNIFIDKGVSSGNFLFGEKIIIGEKEQNIGEYFYTILSTTQAQHSSQNLSKPSFTYKYNHHSKKLHTNADFKEEKNGLVSNIWHAEFEELDNKKTTEIYVYSPNRATWYGVALVGTISIVGVLSLICYLRNRKSQKKEKI